MNSSPSAKGNILDKIVTTKREERTTAKLKTSISELEQGLFFSRPCFSLRDFILNPSFTGIIAEFKRQSPSKGIINDQLSVEEVTQSYAAAGASALSVLTDEQFFGGHNRDLIAARNANDIPILRKDFMLDEYQILEAKSLGADFILLIASILSPEEVKNLSSLAKSLGMSVLLEVHNLDELNRSLCNDLDAVGVNNRNLGTFTVSIQHSYDLVEHIPLNFLKISESGISDPKKIAELKRAGFNGFLIGENFMKENNPGKAMQDFVSQI